MHPMPTFSACVGLGSALWICAGSGTKSAPLVPWGGSVLSVVVCLGEE